MSQYMRNLINKTKIFGQILSESTSKTLTLYHGTCEENGIALIKGGWQPSTKKYGGNMGNPGYLYLSSEPEDALWFAEEKGCNTIIEVINIPIDYLIPDPEDEVGFTMSDLLDRIGVGGVPAKFALTKPMDNSHFRQFTKIKIRECLNEHVNMLNATDIKNELIKRIPFLKQYNIFKNEKGLEAGVVKYNQNVKKNMGDEILNFEQYNVSSEITYFPHKINENTFHGFNIKIHFHVTQPKTMDDLTFKIFRMIQNQIEEKLSYKKEYIVENGENMPKDKLDEIINEMNGVLFKIEAWTEKNNISLF